MRSFFFVFLGITESGSNADISELKMNLEKVLDSHRQPIKFELKGELLILTLTNPDFRFYLSFEKNNHETLTHWKDLAKNAELPWDIKPVDGGRLQNIFLRLEKEGWAEYKPFNEIGFAILHEMESFQQVKVFTIPSMGKSTAWNRIFK